jgi:hypothetical protein
MCSIIITHQYTSSLPAVFISILDGILQTKNGNVSLLHWMCDMFELLQIQPLGRVWNRLERMQTQEKVDNQNLVWIIQNKLSREMPVSKL